MKVILLKFVKDLGHEGDIVEVSDGYAVNSLFPRKLAKQATASVLNKHKMAQKSAQIKQEKEKQQTLEKLAKIDGQIIEIKEKINPKGSLYHALGLKEIIHAIHDQLALSIPNTLFTQKYSFKEKGKYTLELEAFGVKKKCILFIDER